MRQWLVNPKLMCRHHLLGEHVEHHMFIGAMRNHKSITGFIEKNLLEPKSLVQRHEELAKEMIRRGYDHNSEIIDNLDDILSYLSEAHQIHILDRHKSKEELFSRCKSCGKEH